MSRERPILFSAPMVRAILDGTKTQTRRVVSPRNRNVEFIGGRGQESDLTCWGWSFDGPDQHGYAVLERGLDERHNGGLLSIPCPYGEPGDRLWVRETWRTEMIADGTEGVRFAADDAFVPIAATASDAEAWAVAHDGGRHGAQWRPSIFMRRWASRIVLAVTDVRVQRLHDISEDDARAEGVQPIPGYRAGREYVESYADLWDTINGQRAPWSGNPWVWVVSFERAQKP